MRDEKNYMVLMFVILSACASTNWVHQNTNNSNLSFDKGECRSFANSKSQLIFVKIHYIVSQMSGRGNFLYLKIMQHLIIVCIGKDINQTSYEKNNIEN